MSTTPLQPHQQRVVDERAELDERRVKLTAFMIGDVFPTLPVDEQQRLYMQRAAMDAYSIVLSQRIAAFTEPQV